MGRTWSTREIAEYFRVAQDTVRHWFQTEQLGGINVGSDRRVKYRATEEAIEEFKKRRAVGDSPKGIVRRETLGDVEEIVK